jgi:hypothetical protein
MQRSRYRAVSIRFRQQVNKNSKELCWHHAISEMNHNSWWAGGGSDDIAVVIFRHKTVAGNRGDVDKGCSANTPHIHDVWSRGDTPSATAPGQPRRLGKPLLGQAKGVDTEIAVMIC